MTALGLPILELSLMEVTDACNPGSNQRFSQVASCAALPADDILDFPEFAADRRVRVWDLWVKGLNVFGEES